MRDLPLFETDQGDRIAELEAHVARLEKACSVDSAIQMIELMAHVERLRDGIKDIYIVWCAAESSSCLKLLNETPAQSLNEIKAAAIEEFADKYSVSLDVQWDIKNYAKQLREGEE